MKIRRITLYLSILMFLPLLALQCQEQEEAHLTIEHRISGVTLQNIYWGDRYITSYLAPGQSVEIQYYEDQDLPETNPVRFSMVSKGKEIYLETKQQFELAKDDNLVIVLKDETSVVNSVSSK